MIFVLAAILVFGAAGVWAERRHGERAVALTGRMFDVLLYGLLPFITFFAVARLELTAGIGIGLLVAYAQLAIVGGLAYVGSRRILRLDDASTGAVVVTVVLANTGFLGLPLNAVLLGSDDVPEAITWDLSVSLPMLFVVGFGVGAALGTKAGATGRERARSFVMRNPPLLALLAALVVPDAAAPEVLSDAAKLAAIALLPVGFFALGVHLCQEAEDGSLRLPPPITRPVALAVGLRILVAPALFAAGATLASIPDGVEIPDAYYLQAAMPCGINALVVAHVYGLDLRIVAGAVAWATALVVGGALVVAALT
jgi:predicted permease